MPNLDERSLRRAGFQEGPRLTLGDGQKWTLAPSVFHLRCRSAVDLALDLVIDAAGEDVPITTEHLAAWVTVASAQIVANYILDDDQIEALLDFDVVDPANPPRWTAIRRALLGLRVDDGDRPTRTFSRWVRISLLANGVSADMPPQEATELAYLFLSLGKTIDPVRFCDASQLAAIEARQEEFF